MSNQPSSLRKFLTDFCWILKGQMYSLRLNWFWYVVLLSISPLSYMFFLWFYSSNAATAEASLYAISGSIASSAVTAAMLSLGQTIGSMRESNVLEFYATLPVNKLAFVAALAGRGVLFAFPSALVVFLIGAIGLGLQLWSHLGLLAIAYFAGAFSLAGVGAFIGFYSRTPETASLVTQVVNPLLVLFAPVYMPIDRLPQWLQATARVLPTTYAAEAMRAALGLGDMQVFGRDVLILLLFGMATLLLSLRRTSWRLGRTDAN